MSVYKGDTLIAGSGTNMVTLYNKESSDSSINWGYTSGLGAGTYTNKDFSNYKYLKVFCSAESSINEFNATYCVDVDLQNQAINSSSTYYRSYNCAHTPYGTISDLNYFQLSGCNVTINQAKTEITFYIYNKTTSNCTSSNSKVYLILGVK